MKPKPDESIQLKVSVETLKSIRRIEQLLFELIELWKEEAVTTNYTDETKPNK